MLGGRGHPGRRLRHRARLRRGEDAQGDDPLVVLRARGRRSRAWRPRPPTSPCGPSGSCRTPGVTKDHLARVVVKNRRHGVHNPDAMFRAEVDAEAVLASRLVCEPLHLWMLCTPNEGAAAVVLTAPAPTDARRETAARRAVSTAAVLRSHLPGSVLNESTPMSGLVDEAVARPEHAGRHRRLRGSRARARATSTWSSARTPTRHASCCPTKSSACARRAGRPPSLDDGATELRRAHPGEPERGAVVQGRAPGGLGPRAGGHARPPAARRRRAQPGRGGARGAGPHRGAGRQRQRRRSSTR